jgi:hypothetical protein
LLTELGHYLFVLFSCLNDCRKPAIHMLPFDFDLPALYDALDEQRTSRGLTWRAVAEEVNCRRTRLRPIAVSTMTSLKSKPDAEGDGVLQMLLWLRRTPESFVPGAIDPKSDCFCRPTLGLGQILRWDTRGLYEALDRRRRSASLTWSEVARQIRGFTPGMLTNLAKGGRIGLPRVMRLVQWLGEPAASFTRIADW